MIENIFKNTNWFFEKFNKNDKPLANQSGGKRGETQIKKISNEIINIARNSTKDKRKYHKQFYAY